MLHHWYAALASERGISLTVDNVERAKQQLYQARRKAGDDTLAALSIVIPPLTTNELWIIHNDKTERERRLGESNPEPIQG